MYLADDSLSTIKSNQIPLFVPHREIFLGQADRQTGRMRERERERERGREERERERGGDRVSESESDGDRETERLEAYAFGVSRCRVVTSVDAGSCW